MGASEGFVAGEYFLGKKKTRGKTGIARSPSESEIFAHPWGNFMLVCLVISPHPFLFYFYLFCLFVSFSPGGVGGRGHPLGRGGREGGRRRVYLLFMQCPGRLGTG